jgi:Ca-activated chloride channel family protein
MPNFMCSFSSGFHRSLRAIGLSACLMLALCPGARSQSSDQVHVRINARAASGSHSSLSHDRASILRVDTNLVLVPVTVNDAMNRTVTSLNKQNFELYEAGKQQKILYFSTEDSPISVGVLLDLSSSMTDKIDIARHALEEFFNNANSEDDYFVLGFADTPQLLSDTTESVKDLENTLASATPKGSTALLDAIYLAMAKLRKAKYPRRAIFIISDGGDNNSRYSSREIKQLVEESDVEIYAIGIFDSIFKTYEEWAGKRLLTGITQSTGGRTIAVNDVKQLPEAAAAVSQELRNRYLLGYRPSNSSRDEQFRKIKVRLAPPLPASPLHVYFKKGYIASGG